MIHTLVLKEDDTHGTVTVYPEIFEGEYVMEIDYHVTYKGCEAKLYGPPEDCYPAEAAEWEIDEVRLYNEPKGEELEMPKWMLSAAIEYAQQSTYVHDKIADNIAENE